MANIYYSPMSNLNDIFAKNYWKKKTGEMVAVRYVAK